MTMDRRRFLYLMGSAVHPAFFCHGRESPVRVKSGKAHNEPMMSAFHPTATKYRTQFYVRSVPNADLAFTA
jgi:hypothetical protein